MYVYDVEQLKDIQADGSEQNHRWALHDLLRTLIEELKRSPFFLRGNPGVNFYLDIED